MSAHIGILGLDKAGVENYQITLGGDPGDAASFGERLGPGIAGDAVPEAIERIVDTYLGAAHERGRGIHRHRPPGRARPVPAGAAAAGART